MSEDRQGRGKCYSIMEGEGRSMTDVGPRSAWTYVLRLDAVVGEGREGRMGGFLLHRIKPRGGTSKPERGLVRQECTLPQDPLPASF